MQNFQRHVVDKIAQKNNRHNTIAKKGTNNIEFLIKGGRTCCHNEETILDCIQNCQARCMHPHGQSEFLDIDIHPIYIFKKGRTLSVTGERMCNIFFVSRSISFTDCRNLSYATLPLTI